MTEINIPACKCGLGMMKFFANVDDMIEGIGDFVVKEYNTELEAAMIEASEIMEDSLREMEEYCGLDTKESIEHVKAIKKIFKESVGYSYDFSEIIGILKKISNNLNPQLSKCK